MKSHSKTDNLFENRIEIPSRDVLVSTQELAEMFGVNYTTMRRSLATKAIRPIHLPGTSVVRFRLKDVKTATGL